MHIHAYYRIDEQNKLLKSFESIGETQEVLVADFNKDKGDVFYATTDDSTPNNQKITVVEKTDDIIKFMYQHAGPNSYLNLSYLTFRKGVGFDEKYAEIKINGVVYKF